MLCTPKFLHDIQSHTHWHLYKSTHLPTITSTHFYPLTIVQWNRLPPNMALLPDLESFRLAISSLTYSLPYNGSIVFNHLSLHFVLIRLFNILTYHLYFNLTIFQIFVLFLTFTALTHGLKHLCSSYAHLPKLLKWFYTAEENGCLS